MATVMQNAFNTGEITKRLGGRVDLAKYGNALATCLNFLPQPHGGISRRMGTKYIASAKNDDKQCRLVPFEYSTEQAYILEFGDSYIRFYMDGGQIQSVDTETKLLLHFDGDNASTTFTDSGATGHTVTAYGGAKIDATDGVFGQCGLFNGATSYLSIPDHADWFFNNGDFSLETRIKFATLPAAGASMVIVNQNGGNTPSWIWQVTNTAGVYSLDFYGAKAGVGINIAVVKTITPVVDTWYHLGIERSGNDFAEFLGGTQQGTTTVDADIVENAATSLEIGRKADGTSYFNGRMDEMRISKGIARW